MKLLLFSIFSASVFTAAAQSFEYKVFETPGLDGKEKFRNFLVGQPAGDNDSLITAMKKRIEARGLQSGVVNLKQDNMPCVIPNTKLMTPMPNSWNGSLQEKAPGAIPNPARQKPLIISIKQDLPVTQKE